MNEIATLFTYLNNKLGEVNLHDFETLISERDNLALLDAHIFNETSALVVKLCSVQRKTEIEVLSTSSQAEERASLEKGTITDYLATLVYPPLVVEHDKAYREVIDVLENTRLTWGFDFISVIHLIVFFDCEQAGNFRHLATPLAQFCVYAINNHFKKGGGDSEA